MARGRRWGASTERSGPRRSTALRERHRDIIKNGKPPSRFGVHPDCFHCGEPIDYTAGHLEPLSFQIDHLVPLEPTDGGLKGTDTIDNIVPSHRKCNRGKSNKRSYQPGVTYVTDRRWWT